MYSIDCTCSGKAGQTLHCTAKLMARQSTAQHTGHSSFHSPPVHLAVRLARLSLEWIFFAFGSNVTHWQKRSSSCKFLFSLEHSLGRIALLSKPSPPCIHSRCFRFSTRLSSITTSSHTRPCESRLGVRQALGSPGRFGRSEALALTLHSYYFCAARTRAHRETGRPCFCFFGLLSFFFFLFFFPRLLAILLACCTVCPSCPAGPSTSRQHAHRPSIRTRRSTRVSGASCDTGCLAFPWVGDKICDRQQATTPIPPPCTGSFCGRIVVYGCVMAWWVRAVSVSRVVVVVVVVVVMLVGWWCQQQEQ